MRELGRLAGTIVMGAVITGGLAAWSALLFGRKGIAVGAILGSVIAYAISI